MSTFFIAASWVGVGVTCYSVFAAWRGVRSGDVSEIQMPSCQIPPMLPDGVTSSIRGFCSSSISVKVTG
jgi:hypothetical protein